MHCLISKIKVEELRCHQDPFGAQPDLFTFPGVLNLILLTLPRSVFIEFYILPVFYQDASLPNKVATKRFTDSNPAAYIVNN